MNKNPLVDDNLLRGMVVSALRRVSLFTKEREEVLKRAQVGRWKYRCEECKKVVGFKAYDIDHIKPVGTTPGSRNDKDGRTWDDYLKALFCPAENLRLICKPCHKKKTFKKS